MGMPRHPIQRSCRLNVVDVDLARATVRGLVEGCLLSSSAETAEAGRGMDPPSHNRRANRVRSSATSSIYPIGKTLQPTRLLALPSTWGIHCPLRPRGVAVRQSGAWA